MTEIIYFSKLYCAKTHKDPPISSLHLIDFVHSKPNQTVPNNNNLLWKFKKYFFVKIWIQLKAELLMCLLTYFTMDVFLSLKIDKNLFQFSIAIHLFKSCVFSTSRYDDQWMICSVWTCELPSLMLSKIIKLQKCRAVSVSVRSQRNKQIKCSLSSAHFLTFYFLGFGNEEKEKIFPTKIIITAPCLTSWFWRSLVFFSWQNISSRQTLS